MNRSGVQAQVPWTDPEARRLLAERGFRWGEACDAEGPSPPEWAPVRGIDRHQRNQQRLRPHGIRHDQSLGPGLPLHEESERESAPEPGVHRRSIRGRVLQISSHAFDVENLAHAGVSQQRVDLDEESTAIAQDALRVRGLRAELVPEPDRVRDVAASPGARMSARFHRRRRSPEDLPKPQQLGSGQHIHQPRRPPRQQGQREYVLPHRGARPPGSVQQTRLLEFGKFSSDVGSQVGEPGIREGEYASAVGGGPTTSDQPRRWPARARAARPWPAHGRAGASMAAPGTPRSNGPVSRGKRYFVAAVA